MPAHRDTLTGGLFLLGAILSATAMAAIPKWFAPPERTFVALATVEQGTTGLAVGSSVLVGGIPAGRVEAILRTSGTTAEAIEIHFALQTRFPLHADAIIRKEADITGTGGTLYVADLGTPARPFSGDVPTLPLTPAPGGAATVVGPRAAASIARIQARGSHLGSVAPTIGPKIESLVAAITSDIDHLKSKPLAIDAEELKEQWAALQTQFKALGDSEASFEVVQANVETIREDALELQEAFDHASASIDIVVADAKQAIAATTDIVNQIKILIPEVQASWDGTIARTVLAGGQLSRLKSSLFQSGLRALVFKPDEASWSRRQLLEAIEDVVLATISLRQASATLEELANRHPDIASALHKTLDNDLSHLTDRLGQLYDLFVREAP